MQLAVKCLTANEKVWCNGVRAASYKDTGLKYLCVLNCDLETSLTPLELTNYHSPLTI